MRIKRSYRPQSREDLEKLIQRHAYLREKLEDAPEQILWTPEQHNEYTEDAAEMEIIEEVIEENKKVVFNRLMGQVILMMSRMKEEAEKGTNPQMLKDYNELKEGYEKMLLDWEQQFGSMQ